MACALNVWRMPQPNLPVRASRSVSISPHKLDTGKI
jgi:hypothetical protein